MIWIDRIKHLGMNGNAVHIALERAMNPFNIVIDVPFEVLEDEPCHIQSEDSESQSETNFIPSLPQPNEKH